jgi:hypothetical protein
MSGDRCWVKSIGTDELSGRLMIAAEGQKQGGQRARIQTP